MTAADASPDYPSDCNIAARLTEGALEAGWADRPLFHYRDRTLSYGEVHQRAARFAGALRRLGVAPEQRVLIALPDAPAFVDAFLGILRIGAVAVPINPYLPVESYEFFLHDSRAVAAVVSPWLAAPFLDAAARLPRLRDLMVFADPGAPDGGTDDGGWRALTSAAGRPRLHDGQAFVDDAAPEGAADTSADEPAFWLYTSGSTGDPKGAIHLHHDIWVAAECWARRTLDLQPEHVHLSASKLFFAYGLGNSLHCPMWTGGCTVLVPEKPSAENTLAAIRAHRVTHFYAVPSFYSALLADDGFADRRARGDLDSLELCVSAGETLPAPLLERWMEATGVPLIDGIGSTELLHIFIANRPDDLRPGCSGRPIPGYAARVAGEDGASVDDDTVGDLWVRGDSACAGYWNRHRDTLHAIRGEWFVTGDKYRRDADGYYWYEGRADDMFKVHGKWVSPARVESVLLSHAGVREVAVVAATDAQGLACGVAFVVPAGAGDGLEADLLEHARVRLSDYLVPARIELIETLPKTATGKTQRYRLRG